MTEDYSMSEKISPQELKAGKTIVNGIIQEVLEIIDALEPDLPPDVLQKLRLRIQKLDEELAR
jgi:actin-like ATPase involved in cell morphogenesis